jgi:hypothetical protein
MKKIIAVILVVFLGCVPVIRSEDLDKKFTKTQIKTCIAVLRESEINLLSYLAIGQGADGEKLSDEDRKEWLAYILHVREIYNSLKSVLKDRENYHFKE